MARQMRPQVTPALLRAAWLQQPRGPAWPGTFEEAAQHPFFSRLLKTRALGLAQAQLRQQQAPFDARRAAANDLD